MQVYNIITVCYTGIVLTIKFIFCDYLAALILIGSVSACDTHIHPGHLHADSANSTAHSQ